MWGYAYIHCDGCGRRLKIRLGQKTRSCPYCNRQVKVEGKAKELVK
jgi:DNA-directed RNA polymerase subunit RPC12/RpoP